MDKIKLDLGAGNTSPEGYTPLGHDHNTEIFPLPHEDNSVDVIRASHCLEHFSHREIDDVLREWVRALKPGGILRIAVPDFEKVVKLYLDGALMSHPAEWYVMGGQCNKDDFHRSSFDREHLRRRMANAGLVLLRPWESEIDDCAGYPISLNIEGTKPSVSEMKAIAVMSVPRLGFTDNMSCAFDAFVPLGIQLRRFTGAFWGQTLTTAIETCLDELDAVIILDYDSVFSKADVARLVELMMAHPEADAIAAMQSSRHLQTCLFTVLDENGIPTSRISKEKLEPDLMQIATAHFGLTIIRADKLRELPKPWFHSRPDKNGRWDEVDGKIDEDVAFWVKWREQGNTLFLANRVVVGHMELMVRIPGKDLQTIYQPVREYNDTKEFPPEAWS